MALVLSQQVVQDIGPCVLLVVDDEWDGGHALFSLALWTHFFTLPAL
jgi:hypothetical protein